MNTLEIGKTLKLALNINDLEEKEFDKSQVGIQVALPPVTII